ncbi:hypothetical protein [Arenibacter certesii]|uniref:hypothetical protein n=2 Tax=Arenibacter certesii TaxID=228955 RepID=UPI0003FDA4C6|nr:hypothetical protein [Arenibacter certesii]
MKPFIFKYLAIIMGLCYLLNPVRQHFLPVFHSFSHQLELPNYLIPHSHLSNYQEVHRNHDTVTEDFPHEHAILETVNLLFSTQEDNKQSQDLFLFTIKLCILPSYTGVLKSKTRIVETNGNYNMNSKSSKKGFVTILIKPPLFSGPNILWLS